MLSSNSLSEVGPIQHLLGAARDRGVCGAAAVSSVCPFSSTMMSAGPTRPVQLSSLQTYQSTSTSRLKALYSDFSRHKHSNPSSFASNVDWWRRTLEAAVLKGWQSSSNSEAGQSDRLILHASGPALAEVFRYEGVGKPLGLATVIVSLPPNVS